MHVRGATALVTGGSRGIGRAITAELVRRGARVGIVARPSSELSVTAAELDALPIAADLSDRDVVQSLVEDAERQLGPIDILVNNAALVRPTAAVEMTDTALVADLDCNLVAPMRLVRALLPGMFSRGRGHIVNVSSGAAALSLANMTTYCAAKAGLLHYTSALRSEIWRTGVGTTVVELGSVRGTSAYDTALQDPRMNQLHTRLRRWGLLVDTTPAQVARSTVEAIEHGHTHVRLPGVTKPWWALNSLVRNGSWYLFRAEG
jgi:NAD(P)-dependent dehydrogenase (short-subunit alcohol dehydrogenase family)